MVQLLLSYQRRCRWALKSVNAWSTLFVQFNMSIRTCKWLIKETARLFHLQFNTLTANTKKSSKLNSCPIKQVNCIGIGLHALNETLFKIIVILRRLSFGWFVFSIVACIQKVSTNLFSEKKAKANKIDLFSWVFDEISPILIQSAWGKKIQMKLKNEKWKIFYFATVCCTRRKTKLKNTCTCVLTKESHYKRFWFEIIWSAVLRWMQIRYAQMKGSPDQFCKRSWS